MFSTSRVILTAASLVAAHLLAQFAAPVGAHAQSSQINRAGIWGTQDTSATKPYEAMARDLIKQALSSGRAYPMLSELTGTVGHRLSGSPQADQAIKWAEKTMKDLGFDKVWLEPVMVPRWVRGPIEEASVEPPAGGPGTGGGTGAGTGAGNGGGNGAARTGRIPLTICALGGSVGTPGGPITAEVVRVTSFDELTKIGAAAKGKIVFFDRPLDRSLISTGQAYGGAVDQRGRGAVEAAKAGGVAALVRSMTTRLDDVPHTGGMSYEDGVAKVPAAAISTLDAEMLDSLIRTEGKVRVRLELSCETLPDVEQANVIGEIRGTELPDEVILIGGHLDSWDKGTGAHDDGAGCVQSIEALRLLKQAGLAPKRTIRAVMFINEENGLRGAREYADKDRGDERHILAMESDAGGFSPRGFGVSTEAAILERDSAIVGKLARWAYLFEPVDADRISAGGGGADIGQLGRKGVPCVGLRVDGHRYFDYHHSDSDTIDKVNERELQLGAAVMAILAWVVSQEGL